MNTNLEFKMGEMIKEYNSKFNNQNNYLFKVEITRDIYFTRLELCNCEKDRENIKSCDFKIRSYNGLLVLPESKRSAFHILIKSNHGNDLNVYYKTFSHEYTHLIDYFEYGVINGIDNMRICEESYDYEFFSFLSEVRARFRGSLIFYEHANMNKTYANSKESLVDELIKDFNTRIVPIYEKHLKENILGMPYKLATILGQYLAIKRYGNFNLELPKYLDQDRVTGLLYKIEYNIDNASIFENYPDISSTYRKLIKI